MLEEKEKNILPKPFLDLKPEEKKEEVEEEKKEPEAEAQPIPVESKKERKKRKKEQAKAKEKRMRERERGKYKEKEETKKEEPKKEESKVEKPKRQYTPITYRDVNGYKVPNYLTYRMVEKIYSQQLFREQRIPLDKTPHEYVNDKSIKIEDLPTFGLGFERIRRSSIGQKYLPNKYEVTYYLDRCYKEGKAAYALKVGKYLTSKFYDFTPRMSSLILDTVGIYKSVYFLYN